ncbi:MAG TPA: GntR family transcriptional regulator [Gaiellales bacterium]|nr:GntR family transcriptional regulator [Gaiellales bacterium]
MAGSGNRTTPRYRVAADQLAERIQSGKLAAHSRLPSERTVAEQFGLSRMTARQAVEHLVRQGLVYRRPGSGTYVSPPRVVHTLQRLAGFSEQMRAQGIEPSGRVLEMVLSDAVDPAARSALRLRARQRAWMMRRVRFGDGEPLLLETFFVPDAVCPQLGTHDLTSGSLYDLMRRVFRVEPARAHELIEPTTCDAADARHLATRPGSAAILVTRTTYDTRERPVEFARDLYRGDRARFEVDLRS